MQDLKIIRIPTVANTPLVFEFDVQGSEYLVKNLTNGDIYASLNKDAEKGKCALILTECAQELTLGKSPVWDGHTSNMVKIIPTTTSEKGVEVQCLKW